jgi:hypothetical protein
MIHRGAVDQRTIQGSYVFNPSRDGAEQDRPFKRRKVSKKQVSDDGLSVAPSLFAPLLNGAEKCANLREKLFSRSWSQIDAQVQRILRESNEVTLRDVGAFMKDATAAW